MNMQRANKTIKKRYERESNENKDANKCALIANSFDSSKAERMWTRETNRRLKWNEQSQKKLCALTHKYI